MVVIKDLKMPICCGICQFYKYDYENLNFDPKERNMSFRCWADLKLRRIETNQLYREIHETCPLVEIKEAE